MADDSAEVKLGAQTDGLTRGVSSAADSVRDSLAKMADSLKDFSGKNKDTTSEAIKNNADLSRSFVELKGSVTGGYNAIVGVVEKVRGVFVSLAAAIASGAIFKSSVSAVLELEDAVRGLEIVFGMTAEAAEKQNIALKIAGISAESYEQMGIRIARSLRGQQGEWERLGVVIKDANGNLLPLDQIMKNLYTRMQDFKAGTDQDLVVMSLAGRNAKDFASEMQRLMAAEKDATEQAEKYADAMGPDRQQRVEEYRRKMNEFELALEHLKITLGIGVLPLLEKMASLFVKGAEAVGPFISKMQALNKSNLQGLELSVNQTMKAAAALAAAQPASWGGEAKRGQQGAPPIPKSGKLGYTPPPGTGGTDETISMWDSILKASENAYNNMEIAQGSFARWSVSMTRDYWAKVIEVGGLGGKNLIEANNKMFAAEGQIQEKAFQRDLTALLGQTAAYKYNYDAQIAIVQRAHDMIVEKNQGEETDKSEALLAHITELRQRAADQVAHIEDIKRKTVQQTADYEFDAEKNMLAQKVALRQIDIQTSLAQERDALDQRYSIAHAGMLKEIADNPDNPEKLAELYKEDLALKQHYEDEKTRIANQAELDRKQYAIEAANDVQNAFGNLFAALATGGKKWTDTLKDALKSITAQLNQVAGNALAKQLFGAGTSGGNALNDIFGKIFGVGDTGQAAQTTAITLNTAALTANTAALASQAASSALSGLARGAIGDPSSLFSALPFYDQGTPYVPRDTLAVIHRGEAVIPASSNTKSGVKGAAMTMHNNFILSGPVDGRTQHQIAMATYRGTRSALRQA